MAPCRDEITLVLLDLNRKSSKTFQLKLDLQQLHALQECICVLVSLPEGWDHKHLRESDLVLSIGDAAISGEMSLHQNGVTDGTVITVTVLDTALGRWQQMGSRPSSFSVGRSGGGSSTRSSSATSSMVRPKN